MGYIGGSYDGDIAIDDIEFLNCVGCKLLTIYLFHEPEQIAFDFLKKYFLFYPVYWRIQFCTSILNTLHEPFHAAGLIGDSDCDFEFGNCGYVQEYVTDDFDWVLNQGSTSTWGTGPATDHSTESVEGKTHTGDTPCSFLSENFHQSHTAIDSIVN